MAQLKRLTGKQEEVVELSEGARLSNLLGRLGEVYGEAIRGVGMIVFRGEEQVRLEEDPGLAEGDRLTLLAPMAGG